VLAATPGSILPFIFMSGVKVCAPSLLMCKVYPLHVSVNRKRTARINSEICRFQLRCLLWD